MSNEKFIRTEMLIGESGMASLKSAHVAVFGVGGVGSYAVEALASGYSIKRVIVDPSAASFIAALRKRGYTILKANNEVLDGIRRVAVYQQNGNIKITII